MRLRFKVWQGEAIGALQQTGLALVMCSVYGLILYWAGNTFFGGVYFILGLPFVWGSIEDTLDQWERTYYYYVNFGNGKKTHRDWFYFDRDYSGWTWKKCLEFLYPNNLPYLLISERVEGKALDESAANGKLREQSNNATATGDQSESPPQS